MPKPVSPDATVTVAVNGQPWQLAPSFSDAGPGDHVFTVTQKSDGTSIVQFGDGVHGAQPPVGSVVTATANYRAGGGSAGNAAAMTVETPVSPAPFHQVLQATIRNRPGALRLEFSKKRPSAPR